MDSKTALRRQPRRKTRSSWRKRFHPQAKDHEEIEIPGSRAGVSARPIRDALFAQSVRKAPGVYGIGFVVHRLLRRRAEDRIVSLVQECIRRDTVSPMHLEHRKRHSMRKHGKRTYTIAKTYQVCSLLSCLGKVVEKAIRFLDRILPREERNLSPGAI